MGLPAPNAAALLSPLLPALPAAALSTQPAPAVLPLLSPILRQRVQLLASASTEPWLRLLTYDIAHAPKLADIAKSGRLEPHPVSGEVEVDWTDDVETRFRRLDSETLQALVALTEIGLAFRLVWCVNDADGGGDGWRVGEVLSADEKDKAATLASFGGHPTIDDAETEFLNKRNSGPTGSTSSSGGAQGEFDDDDDDDSYWGRYDATPARTPATKRSPVPQRSPLGLSVQSSTLSAYRSSSAEDAYYAQYDSVQPAMDNHDPDEAAAATAQGIDINIDAPLAPPLGLGHVVSASSPPTVTMHEYPEHAELNETQGAWTLASPPGKSKSPSLRELDAAGDLIHHPRPASSASSNGSQTVAKLEATAGKQEQSEFGVKQHVSRSVRSLYLLSRASGIDREEFERLVRTELDILGMIEDHEEA